MPIDLDELDLLADPPVPTKKPKPADIGKSDDLIVPTFIDGADEEDDDVALWQTEGGHLNPSAFLKPVGVTFIGTVLGIEPRRLHKKLAKCRPVARREGGRRAGEPLYDFKDAMRYCVEPRIDLKTWFSSLSTTTMPPILSKAFWEGIRAKNKVMEETGAYWHTADVLDVLGKAFMTIKDTTLLWIEELPGKATLSTEDYRALRRLVNELIKDLQHQLVEMPKNSETPSVVASLEEEIENGDLDRIGGGA